MRGGNTVHLKVDTITVRLEADTYTSRVENPLYYAAAAGASTGPCLELHGQPQLAAPNGVVGTTSP
jgi:hypothetical protein